MRWWELRILRKSHASFHLVTNGWMTYSISRYYPFHMCPAHLEFFSISPTAHSAVPKSKSINMNQPLAAPYCPLWTKSKGVWYIPQKDPAWAIKWYPIFADWTSAAGARSIPLLKKTAFLLASTAWLTPLPPVDPPCEFQPAPLAPAWQGIILYSF